MRTFSKFERGNPIASIFAKNLPVQNFIRVKCFNDRTNTGSMAIDVSFVCRVLFTSRNACYHIFCTKRILSICF